MIQLGSGSATISEGADGSADARITGTVAGWIRALAPSADRSGLQTSGNQRLASALLDAALAGPGPRRRRVGHRRSRRLAGPPVPARRPRGRASAGPPQPAAAAPAGSPSGYLFE